MAAHAAMESVCGQWQFYIRLDFTQGVSSGSYSRISLCIYRIVYYQYLTAMPTINCCYGIELQWEVIRQRRNEEKGTEETCTETSKT